MDIYAAGGRATAITTTGNAACALWIPNTSTNPVRVRRVSYTNSGAATLGEFRLARITARGTATTTVTPDIDSHREQNVAPASGVLLDLAYSAQPTIDASSVEHCTTENAIGAGCIFIMRTRIRIAPNAGLAVIQTTTGDIPAGDWTWEWEE